MVYTGDAAENAVTFSDATSPPPGSRAVTIAEAGISETSDLCTPAGDTVTCDFDGFFVVADLGAGADSATVNGTRLFYSLRGEGDNDTLTGGDSGSEFFGG